MVTEVERMMQEEEDKLKDSEADIGDEEMAEHLAGVRASIGRKFSTKRELAAAAAKRDASGAVAGPSSYPSASGSQPSGAELMSRGGEILGQMRNQNRTWIRGGGGGRGHRGGRGGQHEERGGKKRKFLKPSE
jgi:hypothetical protein